MVGRYLDLTDHKFYITPKVAEIFLEKKRNKKKGRPQNDTDIHEGIDLSGSSGAIGRPIITHIIFIRNEFQVSKNQFLHTKRRIKLLYIFLLSSTSINQRDTSDFYTSSISKPPDIFEWKELKNQYTSNERPKIIVFHSSYIISCSPKGKIQRKISLNKLNFAFNYVLFSLGVKFLLFKIKFRKRALFNILQKF